MIRDICRDEAILAQQAEPAGPEADPQTAPEEKEDDDEREDH